MTTASSSLSTAAPVLIESNATGTAQHMAIDLNFNMDMALGTGTIYITDGAVQTVIDPDTGIPTMRIVGATDTRVVAPESIHISGNHVVIDGYDLKPGHNYSILMTPGALMSTTQHQFAGLTNPADVSFNTDGQGPSLAALELSNSTLAIGGSATLTITFSEAVTDFNAAAVSTPNAVLTDLRTEDHITWHATLSPATANQNVEAGGAVSVDMSRVYDGAGNAGVASSLTASYLVDTRPPVLSIMLGEGTLGGSHNIDVTFTFSEAVKDLPQNAIVAPHATVSGLRTLDHGHTWVATLTSAETVSSTGNVISVDMTKVFDLAGNGGSGTTSSVGSYAVMPPPIAGLAATVSLDAAKLGLMDTITVTITFSEGVGYVDPSAITAQNAQLFDLHPLDDAGTVWVAEMAADGFGIDDTTNVLSIDLARIVSTANHVGTTTVTSANYEVDTASSYIDPDIEITDTGIGETGEYTKVDHLNVYGAFVGYPGQTLKLVLDGTPVADSSIYVPTEGEGYGYYTWSARDSTVLADGQHVLTAWLEDAQGRRSAEVTRLFTVDAHGPLVLTPASGSTLDVGAPLALNFNEAVYIDPEDEYLEVQLLDRQTGFTSSIYIDQRYLSSDHKTLTIPADELHLAAGHDYTLTLPRWLTDMASNEVANGEMVFHTSGSYNDTVAPKAVHAQAYGTSMTEDGEHYGVGATIEITVHFTEPVRAVSGQTPTILLNNGGTAYFDKVVGREMTFIYRVGAGDGSVDRLDVKSTSGLVGKVADFAGNVLGTADIKFSTMSLERGWNIVIDTVAPAKLPVPQMDSASDTGVSHSDFVTAETRPVFHGTGAEPTAPEIRIYDGGAIVGYGYPNSDGTWTGHILDNRPLSNGVHTLTFMQVDLAGNLSPLSDPIQLTVDTRAPSVASTTTSVPAGGTYVLTFDEQIDVNSIGNVTLFDASGHEVALITPGNLNWTVAHDASGAEVSVLQIPGRANGSYRLHMDHAFPADLAGNVSSASVQDLVFGVGLDGPHATAALVDGAAGAYGIGQTIRIGVQFDVPVVRASEATPTLLLNNGASAVYSHASADGRTVYFEYTVAAYDGIPGESPDNPMAWLDIASLDGLAGTFKDAYGIALAADHIGFSHLADPTGTYNGSGISLVTLPAVSAPQLADGSDSGVKGDLITSAQLPQVHGTGAEAYATVDLYELSDGAMIALGSTEADASGNWTIDVWTLLANGVHTLFAQQSNDAGKISGSSSSLELTIAPPAKPVLQLSAGSDSSTKGDWLTNLASPTIAGTAEAGAKVDLFEGSTLLGSAVADSSGVWTIPTSLLEGVHNLSARQTDIVGSASELATQSLVIDKTAPAQLAEVSLDRASDSGVSDTDNITKVTRPYIVGSGAEANAKIELFDGDVLVASGAADKDGNWKLAPDSALADGEHRLSVRQTDSAGNASMKSEAIVVHIDTVGPTPQWTNTVPALNNFELYFSEPVVHDAATSTAYVYDSSGTSMMQLGLGISNYWTDNVTRDGHITSVFSFTPSSSGWIDVSLTGVQDLAGNATTVTAGHYNFTLLIPTAINLLPYLHIF